MPEIFDPDHNEVFDNRLRSKWGRLRGPSAGGIYRIIPPDEDRVAITLTIFGLHIDNRIYFGGPTGDHGQTRHVAATPQFTTVLSFNIDDEPLLTTTDIWVEALNNPNGASAQTLCCK